MEFDVLLHQQDLNLQPTDLTATHVVSALHSFCGLQWNAAKVCPTYTMSFNALSCR